MSLQEWIAAAFTYLALVFLAASGVGTAVIVLYRLFLHPLASVPGPRWAAISSFWYAMQVRDGRMLVLGKTLHKKYGPVVRVAPNEVWFDSPEAFRVIYRAGSGYQKSDFYLATILQRPTMDWCLRIHFPDTLDFLSERNIDRYRLQRRLVGPLYRMDSVQKYEDAVDGVLERVVARIHSLDGAEVDLKEWMHIIAVECLGAIVLSWSPGYLRDKTDWGTSSHGYLSWRRKSVFGLFPVIVKAELISKKASHAFARMMGLTYRSRKDLKPFFPGVYRHSSRRIANALNSKPTKSSKPPKAAPKDAREDLLADLIKLHKEKLEFNETYLRRMAVTNFGAGHETMCSALTSIMAMIGSRPSVQRRVADEIRSAVDPARFDNAIFLRYTQAVIKEAQRLHSVLGMSLSRTVPPEGLRVHGYFFPAGTTVGCNPVALHRNPEIVGADADVFDPDRWLGDPELRRRMERYNLTWGGGGRTCPGRHLAYLVLYKVVPTLLREFELEVTLPPEEEVRYYFMAMLTGVKARFRPRGDAASQQKQTSR
ncbi:cytochrome P450 76C2 [Sodiomyces alkalinus F11]|uniref:Cytochrome P450 76C2 n=1 Tax=Sodiomyces alkalinus (strain CBS 110278 / VKM F-3762 / F11) TaxID=1314773 RepID=A0A3N2PX45_SODAK|nr:cytochrome P450 76C2 [Sodiomyces alkalinus F11]ROT39091.1 cytochrome P450 76C2 [Sodiomyces alkalinus F11]